ncbi:YtpR family tRNA-binding protein [Spiroplasma endosymbiont of Labia minor]|uniref:YtpR family tRNA-binding protein n=1 Tax=Spiroplasma endosymbiont of Labia minor TaxID=3066305 RepID=UPI0030D00CFC
MWGINYLASFDTLIVQFLPIENNLIKKNDDFILFYKDEKLVGANFFNVSKEINFEIPWLGETSSAIKFIIKKLNSLKLAYPIGEKFVIGRILTCEKIESTHLHKTTVDFGNNELAQIICGANNVEANKLVVAAKDGAVMFDWKTIVYTKLKGIDSNGMLVSKKELNIERANFNDDGIIILEEEAYKNCIGKSFWQVIENNETKI